MNRKEVKHDNHPLIDLSDILEVLFFDHQFAKCWTCRKTCHQNYLQITLIESMNCTCMNKNTY